MPHGFTQCERHVILFGLAKTWDRSGKGSCVLSLVVWLCLPTYRMQVIRFSFRRWLRRALQKARLHGRTVQVGAMFAGPSHIGCSLNG
jgi:hypothetical protein